MTKTTSNKQRCIVLNVSMLAFWPKRLSLYNIYHILHLSLVCWDANLRQLLSTKVCIVAPFFLLWDLLSADERLCQVVMFAPSFTQWTSLNYVMLDVSRSQCATATE